MSILPTRQLRRFFAAIVALSFVTLSVAQSAGTGIISGRVQNVTRGDYLNNASVTVEGTNLSALTNEFGEYQITNVPAGDARVRVFYSGIPEKVETVTVTAGGRTVRDFNLQGATASDIVQLAAYTVSEAREMSQSALATNEQRFAPNLKTVLSAEEFGEQSENNVAEFLKLMPGVSVSYVEQDARNVSLRGLPAHATIVTSNGNQLASAASGSASRVFEFEQVSMNEIARVEINKGLLPDMPAEGIGGTINLITKSAFERSRPSFSFRSYLNFNTTAVDIKKTPGPFRDPTYKIRPGFDFSYINPLSKNFGITVSGSYSDKFNPQWFADPTWTEDSRNRATPYMSRLNYYDGPKSTERSGGRIGFDWRFTPRDVISIGYSQQYYRALIGLRRHVVQPGSSPTTFDATHVQGRAGAGTVMMTASQNDKSGTTWTPDFKYQHRGPVWNIEAGGAYSHAGNDYRAAEKGFFSGVTMTVESMDPNNPAKYIHPTVRLDYTGNYMPLTTAKLSNGTTIDPRDARNFVLSSVSSLRRKSNDIKKTLRLNAARDFDTIIPLRVKVGGDYREAIRDIRETTPSWNFVGPDGIQNSADNFANLYDIFDEEYSTVAPRFNQQGGYYWFDVYKVYDLFVKHPDWFQQSAATLHNNLVDKSKNITESIASGFIRFDTHFFRNRLLVSGGVRYQDYKVRSQFGKMSTLGRYLHDEEGNLIVDPVTGNPILVGGTPDDIAVRSNIERGMEEKNRVKDFYPSISTIFRLTENLQLRAAYAESINYPQLDELTAVTTVSDYNVTYPTLRINGALKPWNARNYDLGLEYFTRTGGSWSAGVWRKEMKGFISTTYLYDEDADAELRRLGYESLIPFNYRIQLKANGGDAVMEGFELAMRQNLDEWMPRWARGVEVFANTSFKGSHRGKGVTGLDAEAKRQINFGGSFRRGRFATTLKFNHVQEDKRLFPSSSATHDMTRTYTDADINWRLTKRLTLFASGTNIFGVPVEFYKYNVDGTTPEYARRTAHRYFGVQVVAGIKGSF